MTGLNDADREKIGAIYRVELASTIPHVSSRDTWIQ